MPDESKFQKLREIGYRIPNLCATCKFARFSGKFWGLCLKNKYLHEKHTGPERPVSIVKLGTCDGHVENPLMVLRLALGAHEEFLDSRKDPPPATRRIR